MYYINEHEEEVLLNELLHDDSTSCSSLATTVSVTDDIDELYLGAEANSFVGVGHKDSGRPLVDSSDKLKNYCNPLIAVKLLYSSFESDSSTRTFSSISNVDDLLQAREGNPCEFLAALGFFDNSHRIRRRDILSRFKRSPLLSDEDNKIVETSQSCRGHRDSSCQLQEESRTKAREWLNDQLNNKENHNSSKVLSVTTEPSKKPWIEKQGFSKLSKARIKYSKSRQSSFDLLPLLKEDPSQEDEIGEISKNILESRTSFVRPKVPDRCRSFTSESVKNHSSNSEKSTVNDLPNQDFRSQTVHSSLKTLTNETNGCAADQIKNRSLNLLLQPTRMESFELEEINSINGETPEGKRQFVQDSVAAAGSSLTNAGSFCASRPSSIRHSLDQESETSSGFDDDDTMNTTANLCASSSDNVCDTVFIPSATEDTIQVDQKSKPLLVRPKLFDVENLHGVLSGTNNNSNNNNNSTTEMARKHASSHNTNIFHRSHYVHLKCHLPSQTSRNRAEIVKITPVRNCFAKLDHCCSGAKSQDLKSNLIECCNVDSRNKNCLVKQARPASCSVIVDGDGFHTASMSVTNSPDVNLDLSSLEQDGSSLRVSSDRKSFDSNFSKSPLRNYASDGVGSCSSPECSRSEKKPLAASSSLSVPCLCSANIR